MKTFTFNGKAISRQLLIIPLLFAAFLANGQRSYQITYSNNIQGDFDMVGNTVLAAYSGSATNPDFSSSMNSNTTGNGRNMKHIDLDGTSGNGASTRNSTMARLNLPAGSTVIFAQLTWGGRANKTNQTDGYNMSLTANRTIKFRKGTGAYADVAATQVDIIDRGDFVSYQCSAPVTISGDPNDQYWAGNLAVSTGNLESSGAYGAWSLFVVYTNPSSPYKSIRVYDGFQWVYDDGTPTASTFNLSGLSIPTGAGSNARMATLVWEGDGDLTGDYIKINNTTFSDALNPSNNPWNGTISTKGAVLANTSRSPFLTNQMSIDIDQIDVSSYIPSGSNDVSFELFTEQDSYFPSIFAFSANMSAPVLTLDKTGTTSIAPFNRLDANELITYTMSGSNTGGAPLTNCFITDTIPFGLTYEPGTLVINSNAPGGPTGAQTDANDAYPNAAFKGVSGSKHYVKFFVGRDANYTLQPGDAYSVQFKCKAPSNANNLLTVYNTARIQGTSAGINYFDDGTAIIGPGGITLAVKLTEFKVTKEGNHASLKWATSGELKNDRFDIERSTDGVSFAVTGSVQGNGTTTDNKHYQYNDAIPADASMVYYRLKIIDTDGKITYSTIVALRLNGLTTLNNFTIYPNPFTTNVKMQINSAKEAKITVRFSNAAGIQELSRAINLQKGDNIVVLQDLESLKPGLHILEIISEDGKIAQKIIKK